MTPQQRYQRDLEEGLSADPAQAAAVSELQRLYGELIASDTTPTGWLARLCGIDNKKDRCRGIYLWGGVGRGKTYLVDAFYDCLPFEDKMRMHFHRFMRYVHAELKILVERKDPLELVANRFSEEVRVICLDEFHIADITDAMLLGNLLHALFERDVALVTTSNEEPDSLYRDGLQRARFLPAIDLLKEKTVVLNVDGGTDYRLRVLERAEIYHSPLDAGALVNLERTFGQVSPDAGEVDVGVDVEGRIIQAVRLADGVVWFRFAELCGGPRGPGDYIELGRCYQTVLLEGVPSMDASRDDEVRRFITLIDEFYDRNVKLIISAEREPQWLYTGKRLAKPFLRTVSRLNEMRSHEYLARPHLSD